MHVVYMVVYVLCVRGGCVLDVVHVCCVHVCGVYICV